MEPKPAAPIRYVFHKQVFSAEQKIIGQRRAALGLGKTPSCPQQTIGLALSGGGIRSATFSLGVLQSLAKRGLLPRFDYLSTVSGGGYIGCYFGSLFLPNTLREGRGEPPRDDEFKAAAETAYKTLGCSEVAAPISDTVAASKAGESNGWSSARSLSWLRDNGRYLAPRGAGDLLFAIAMQIRNWAAVQYVIATLIVALLLSFALARAWLISQYDWWREIERAFLPKAGHLMYWSPGWVLVAAFGLFVLLPPGVAYWFVHARVRNKRELSWLPLWHEIAILFSILLTLTWAYSVFKVWAAQPDLHHPLQGLSTAFWVAVAYVLMTVTSIGVFFVGLYLEQRARRNGTPLELRNLRNRFTRWLAGAFQFFLVGAGLALLGSLGQTLYAYYYSEGMRGFAALVAVNSLTSVLLVAIARQSFKFIAGRDKDQHARIPVNALAALAAILLLLLTGTLWALVTQAILWMGGPPPALPQTHLIDGQRQWLHASVIDVSTWLAPGTSEAVRLLPAGSAGLMKDVSVQIATGWITLLWAGVVFLFVTTGYFVNFLNMSTLHSLYAARLTRSYLGATNRKRFPPDRVIAVTSPLPGDALSLNAYYDERLVVPVHLINTTINETRPTASQLVQRDRKGLNMTIGPGFTAVGKGFFARDDDQGTLKPADGDAVRLMSTRTKHPCQAFPSEQLGLGDWCAISGAAFSTGLGMKSSLGLSLLAGLANVRLGYWWNANVSQRDWLGLFAAHRYLWGELMADFKGPEKPLWFLTDGGHFDNTGVYELVRRRVGIIVLCDNGCDTDFHFEDLGNLSRKIRTDFGAIMEEIPPATRKQFGLVGGANEGLFGSAEEFANPHNRQGRCALLYRIRYEHDANSADAVDQSLLIVLKPNVIGNVPVDVSQYAWANADFPHQTTIDQFFDDAQWESYRMLGELIGDAVVTGPAISFDGWYKTLSGPAVPRSVRQEERT